MFFAFAIPLALGTLITAFTRGGRSALWGGWFIGMLLLPVWLTMQVGSLLIDLRAVAAVCGLLGLAFGLKTPEERNSKQEFRLLPADVLIVVLVLIQAYSQWRIGRVGPLTIPEIARKWLLPYVVGRFFLGSLRDLDRILPLACKLFMTLSVFAIVEAVIKVNLMNRVLGKTYGLLEQGEGYRWGLKRAQGPLDHPIFFGMMLVLLFPWAVEASNRALKGRGPKWWLLLTPAMGTAIIVTVSRGAQIAGFFTIGMTVFFQNPRWRIAIIILAILGGVGAYGSKQLLSETLSKMAGEKEDETRLISINGDEVEYTGTNHRILLFKVYEDAIANTGLFGFGYELQGIELEESIAQRFGSIDDHYNLFLLQHGYAAIGSFLILALLSILDLGIIAWDPRNPAAGFAGASCGAMVAVTVSLLSVWFAPDFGMIFIFSAGLAGNLRTMALERDEPPLKQTTMRPIEAIEPRRRLVPAHAPTRPIPRHQEPGQ